MPGGTARRGTAHEHHAAGAGRRPPGRRLVEPRVDGAGAADRGTGLVGHPGHWPQPVARPDGAGRQVASASAKKSSQSMRRRSRRKRSPNAAPPNRNTPSSRSRRSSHVARASYDGRRSPLVLHGHGRSGHRSPSSHKACARHGARRSHRAGREGRYQSQDQPGAAAPVPIRHPRSQEFGASFQIKKALIWKLSPIRHPRSRPATADARAARARRCVRRAARGRRDGEDRRSGDRSAVRRATARRARSPPDAPTC